MKSEQEIREHIKGLKKLLFDTTYSEETKRMFWFEIQILKSVLEDDLG